MKHVLISLCLFALAPVVHAWDPVSVFNNAVQGQVNQQIRQGVNQALRSITQPSVDRRVDSVDIPDAKDGIVLYTRPGCGFCRLAREHMQRRGIRYIDKDVNADREARREFEALGGRGVPLILMGSRKLHGFSESSFDAAYVQYQTEHAVALATPAVALAADTRSPDSHANTHSGFSAGDVLVARIARVKLLAEAQPQARVLGQLGKGEEVVSLGETQNRHLKVRTADLEGWVAQALLAKP